MLPSRLASERVPNKALATVAGLPLVEHVRRRALEADVGPVVVASSDPEILDAVRDHGGRVHRTGEHANGTRRVAEVARVVEADVVLNVQADQPLLDPASVRLLAELVHARGTVATLGTPWPEAIPLDRPEVVKVWRDEHGFAVDFSRRPLRPDPLRHLGLYGFPRDLLLRVTSTPIGERARAEGLEQLTWLEAGHRIAVGEVPEAHPPVDTPAQLQRVRQILGG